MAMTPAQKKATDAFKKKLDQSIKHVAGGGSGSSWSSGGSGSSGSGSSSKTVPYDFVGPLQPGVTREPAPETKTSSYNQPIINPTQYMKYMSASDKLKYYYGKTDIALGGYLPGSYTPSQITARNTAQRNAEQYRELLDKSFSEVVKEGTKYTPFSWAGTKYNPSIVTKVLTKKATENIEALKIAQTEEPVRNLISNTEADINNFVNQLSSGSSNFQQELQNKVDNREISVTEANKRMESFNKSLNSQIKGYVDNKNSQMGDKLNAIDREWYETEGKAIEEKYNTKIRGVASLNKISGALSVPKLTLTGVVTAGAGTGISLLGTTATSVATGAGVGLFTIAGASAGVGLYQQAQSQGGLSKLDVASVLVPLLGHTIVGIAGGIGGAKIGQEILINRATPEINAFKTKLATNEKIQQQYLTKANIQQGFIEKQFGKVKVKIEIPQKFIDRINFNKLVKREGVTELVGSKSIGLNTRKELSTALQEQLKFNKVKINENSIGEVRQQLVTRITGQTVKTKDWYSVKGSKVVNGKTEIIEMLVRFTKEGGIKELVVTKGNIQADTGLGIFQTGKVSLKPIKTKIPVEGSPPLEVSTIGVTPKKSFFARIKLLSTTKGEADGTLLNFKKIKFGSANVKKGIVSASDDSSLFGGKEGIRGFLGKKLAVVAKDKDITPGFEGSLDRVEITSPSLTNEGLFVKNSKSVIYEKSFAKPIARESFLFSEVKPKIVPKPVSTSDSVFSIPKPKPSKITSSLVSDSPKITPKVVADYPSYVDMGGSGKSLFQFDGQSAFAELADSSFSFTAMSGSLPKIRTTFSTPTLKTSLSLSNELNPSVIGFSSFQANKEQNQNIIPNLISDRAKPIFDTGDSIKMKQSFTPVSTLGLFSDTRARVGIKAITKPSQATAQTIKPMTFSPLVSLPLMFNRGKTPSPTPLPDITGFFGLPGLGAPKTGGGQKGKQKKTSSSFFPTYNPSLGSVLSGQKARKITKEEAGLLSSIRYSGLESRPFLEIVSSKEKKIKKKKKK